MKINIDIKSIIIVVLAIIVLLQYKGCSGLPTKTVKETTRETIDKVVTEKTNSVEDLQVSKEKPDKQKIAIDSTGKVTKIDKTPKGKKLEGVSAIKTVNKFKREFELPNGTVNAEILTDGALYGTSVDLKTMDTTITRTKIIERVEAQSGVYGFGGTTIGVDSRVMNVFSGISYLHKNRWFVGAGASYNLDPYSSRHPVQNVGVTLIAGVKF